MSSVFSQIVLLIIAGIVGGYAAGLAVKEHSLGTTKSLLVGGIGGLCGYFLQSFVPLPPLAASTGDEIVADTPVEHLFILALVGLVAGGILALVLGYVTTEMSTHRPK
jgi:hypothetical protein